MKINPAILAFTIGVFGIGVTELVPVETPSPIAALAIGECA